MRLFGYIECVGNRVAFMGPDKSNVRVMIVVGEGEKWLVGFAACCSNRVKT